MAIVKINQQLNRVDIGKFELENEIVFKYFDNLPSGERDEMLFRCIYIGVLAQMEDRFSAFLSNTKNELGTELESLKMIFDMNKELFEKASQKGVMGEDAVLEVLTQYVTKKKYEDIAFLTGNTTGEIPKNKTGDILVNVGGNESKKIAIECKFDKSVKVGDISDRNIFLSRKTDTAWSQLIESNANRGSETAIIVFDRSSVDASIVKEFENVGFIPEIGFVAIVDTQRGDYTNLLIAYDLSRNIITSAKPAEGINPKILTIIVKRLVRDMNDVILIKSLVEDNIANNVKILEQLEKATLLAEFNQTILDRFLETGTLTKMDLFEYYDSDGIRDKFKVVQKEIHEDYSQ